MKQVLIDRFTVPLNALEEFVTRMNYNRNFIHSLPGFIKDTVYKRTGEDGDIVIVTVAEWQDADSLTKAKEVVQTEYKRIGFDPAEMLTRLNIKMEERGIYNEMTD